MFRRSLASWLLWALLLAPVASLACEWQPAPANLGSVTTQRVLSGEPIVGSGLFHFRCSGTLLTLIGLTPGLEVRFAGDANGQVLTHQGHEIPYDIYLNANQTSPVVGGLLLLTIDPAQVLGLLTTGAGAELPVYFVTRPGANVPAGTYTDSVQVVWKASNICEGVVALGLCVGNWTHGELVATMQLSLTVGNDCTVTAPTVDFGSAPLPGEFAPVSQHIQVLCSRDVTFSVGLSGGEQPQGGRRHMVGAGARLAYDLFKADQSVWGDSGAARAPGPGPADGVTVQTIPYTARVYPDQPSPPAGSYSDRVVVDVSF